MADDLAENRTCEAQSNALTCKLRTHIHMQEQRQKCVVYTSEGMRIVDFLHVQAAHAKQTECTNELVLALQNKTL